VRAPAFGAPLPTGTVEAVPESVTPSPFASADLAGRLLGDRYRIGSVIASGGMAQVRRATDEVLGREVAVKILHPHLASDATLVDRFRREAVAAARLTHPSIVAIYDTLAEDGINAIVMELVHGLTLRQFLDEHGALDPRDAVDVVAGVAEALAVAHAAGIVHRDVKPANILMCDDRRVKVADFGIAKAGMGADLTHTGTMIGTAKYLAPEQVEGRSVDPRTDVYSLGVVLYECLTGRVPFEGDSDATIALARLQRDPIRPRQVRPSVPRSLDTLTMTALARDPDDRPHTADAFRASLLRAQPDDQADVGADHTTIAPLAEAMAAEPAAFTRSERRWMVPAVLVILIGVALALSGLLLGRTEPVQQLFDRARDAVTASGVGTSAGIEPVTLVGARAFDPLGDDWEHDDLAPLAIDGDPGTEWHTEFYDVGTWSRKGGVGLVVVLDRATTVHQIEIESSTGGWAASIHVTDDPSAPDLDAWGPPRGSAEGMGPGTSTIDIEPTNGGAVLIWITDLGDGPPNALRTHIGDVTVRGR
jgi:eukaryotic-like serine/threonine-protein kinase